jgi:CheY-like chemotaxis protein
MQILIASQVAPVRHTLRVLLEKDGHKVHLADSMTSALEALAKHLRLDVVICEWKLDDGKAVALHRRCQEIDRMTDNGIEASAPHFIVLATPKTASRLSEGHSISDEIQSFGFSDVFEKPLNRHALMRRIREIAKERDQPVATPAAPSNAAPPSPSAPPADGAAALLGAPLISAGRISQLEVEVGALRAALDSHNQRLMSLAQTLRELARECEQPPDVAADATSAAPIPNP